MNAVASSPMRNLIDFNIFNPYAVPPKACQIGSLAISTQLKIQHTQQRIGVRQRPDPVTALAFQPTKPGNFLFKQGIPVPVRREGFDSEAALGQMVLIPIFRKPAAVMVRRHVDIRTERSGQDQLAAGFEQACEFIKRMGGFGHVLQNLAAKDGVKTGIGCRDCGDVADQIDTGRIPTFGLQALIKRPATRTLVLTEVLRHVVQVTAVLAVFQFAGASIKHARAFLQCAEGLLQPCLAVEFVDIFIEHGRSLLRLRFGENKKSELIMLLRQFSKSIAIDIRFFPAFF